MRSVLVTGGSSGIGRAVAYRAAEEKWNVFVGYRSGRERAENIVREIHGEGGNASAVLVDLQKPETIPEALSFIASQTHDL